MLIFDERMILDQCGVGKGREAETAGKPVQWCGVKGIIMRIRISINSYPSPETSSCWRRIHTSELLRIDRLHADVVKAVRKERLILQPSTLLSMNRIAIRDVRSTPPP
ncbi:hypothetical protein DTO164E3_5422 [Paecilomyces variotii]|nr:hypothetical protein DTO164E3_5422 [Paecilomyces variotii]